MLITQIAVQKPSLAVFFLFLSCQFEVLFTLSSVILILLVCSVLLKVKSTPKIKAAIEKYKELSETSAVKLLKAARESVTKLEAYFRDVDLTLADDNGKPIFHAKDLISNLSNMAKVVQSLDELEDLVKKQQQKDNPNRGGVVTNKYSQ